MKIIFFFFLICSMAVSGCTTRLEKMVKNNLAEYREFVVYGESSGITATLMCGSRECEYKINGYATELIEFGVLTLHLGDDIFASDDTEYVLFVGTKKYTGNLERNPFDGTLVADVKEIVDKNANISVVIKLDSGDVPIKLGRIDSDWVVDGDDCIDILVEKYKEEVNAFVNNGVFEGEVYIKIMHDDKSLARDFYYLISVYGRNGKSINVIVSPFSGNILASNTNV